MLKSLLPNNVKVFITIDDIRLKSKSTTNNTEKYTRNSFIYTMLGSTESQLGV